MSDSESVPKYREPIGKGRRFDVMVRDRFTCQYCGRSAPDITIHVDHIFPASKGGTDDVRNLVTSCRECNAGKTDKVIPHPRDAEIADFEDLIAIQKYVLCALSSEWLEDERHMFQRLLKTNSVGDIIIAINIMDMKYLRHSRRNDHEDYPSALNDAYLNLPSILRDIRLRRLNTSDAACWIAADRLVPLDMNRADRKMVKFAVSDAIMRLMREDDIRQAISYATNPVDMSRRVRNLPNGVL